VARGGGYLANLEVVKDVPQTEAPAPKIVEWSVDFGGTAKQDQALLLMGSSLYAFGGNNTRAPHDFTKDAFSKEAFKFDLAGRSVEKLDDMPAALQGGVAFLAGERIDQSIYVLGGLGMGPEKFQSLDTIYQYRLRSKAWMEEVGHLPTTRGMFSGVGQQGTFWTFGGARSNTADKGLVADTWTWTPGTNDVPAKSEVVAEAAIPTLRRSFAGALIGKKYYVIGGLGESQIVEQASVFDFETKKWSEIASPKQDRVFPSVAVSGGKIYLYGGFAITDGHFQPASLVEVYDPEKNAWETAWESLPFADRVQMLLEFQDRLLFYGIDRSQDGKANFVVVDPRPRTVVPAVATVAAEEPQRGPGIPRDVVTRLMRMDKNMDGKVSLEEVGERFRPIFKRADKNQDGFATQAELQELVNSSDRRQ